MKYDFRTLVRHMSVYAIGMVLSRVASLLMLPVYTSYLEPAQYGQIALLDLFTVIVGTVIGAGLVTATTRHYFSSQSERDGNCVWWTGWGLMVLLATIVVLPLWCVRNVFILVVLGPNVEQGADLVAVVLPTIWIIAVGSVPIAYLRARKWSGRFVVLSLAQLVLNITLNVYFLSAGMGVFGILLGNLIANSTVVLVYSFILVASCGKPAVDVSMAGKLLRFGGPLVAVGLLSVVLHQADRYLLRVFVSLHDLGIYSLAYMIGYAVSLLCVMSFEAIWSVVMYEIAKRPDAREVFALAFQYFVYGMSLVVFSASLFAKPILSIMAAPAYSGAADLIPLVGLGYIFFGMHVHFKVPALLANRTLSMLPAYSVAAVANISLNLLLIPLIGILGAAVASVLTFMLFSAVGLWQYRRIDKIDYPLARCATTIGLMSLSFVAFLSLERLQIGQITQIAVALLLWIVWAAILFGGIILRYVSPRTCLAVQEKT